VGHCIKVKVKMSLVWQMYKIVFHMNHLTFIFKMTVVIQINVHRNRIIIVTYDHTTINWDILAVV